jgi:chromosome segregation ATPase
VADLSERIKKLESELKNTNQRLKVIIEASLKLENQNRSEIGIKEKKLEDWRNKLETCQQERNQIKKEIREKVVELEKSDLTNTEKQAKINQLLTKHSQELEEVDRLLYSERSQYRKVRDKIFEELLKPCLSCKEKNIILKEVNKKVRNLI